MQELNFTIIIPSKKVDKNLIKCVSNIRLYYNFIPIILLLDNLETSTDASVWPALTSTPPEWY